MKPNAGINYSQSPTIAYSLLQGEDFLKSVLSPISLEALLVMTQSGWSIERVFGICIERINNLLNAPRASGPTPEDEPKYKKFKRLLVLLRQLQLADLIEIGSLNSRDIVLHIKKDPYYQNTIDELLSLLEVSPKCNLFKLSTNFLDVREDQWNVRTRSIAGILFYLSQNVEVPEKHKEDGLVTITKTKEGKEFNWDDTPAGMMFKVRARKWLKPRDAFIAVPYRGAWFYIADNDLQSKSTFKLLNQLFNMQAGQIQYSGPTLTLPVGAR